MSLHLSLRPVLAAVCAGATHLVRPEDFPVMPVETVGFHLKPVSFFKHNPALDLPRVTNTASKLACCSIQVRRSS